MAALKPRTPDELRSVKGVGDRKLDRYGPAFLRVIAGESPSPPPSGSLLVLDLSDQTGRMIQPLPEKSFLAKRRFSPCALSAEFHSENS